MLFRLKRDFGFSSDAVLGRTVQAKRGLLGLRLGCFRDQVGVWFSESFSTTVLLQAVLEPSADIHVIFRDCYPLYIPNTTTLLGNIRTLWVQ